MTSERDDRRFQWLLWPAVCGCGLALWLACFALQGPAVAWQALLVNFIFFVPLGAAMIVWPAAVLLSRGQWLGELKQTALAGIVMAPLSLVAFAGLWLGRHDWASWLSQGDLPNKAWLDGNALFIRDGAALAIWWLAAGWFALKTRRPNRSGAAASAGARSNPGRRSDFPPLAGPSTAGMDPQAMGLVQPGKNEPGVLAGGVGVLYAVVFSLLAFDLVMALDPRWVSALFGGYYFFTGLYAAIVFLTVIAVRQPNPDKDRLHDLAKLVLAFSIATTYLMFSQLLPLWFENLPNEIRFLVPRMKSAPWAAVSVALLGLVYLGPLVLLLPIWAKRTRGYLGAVCLLILAGLWVERWWLAAPALGRAPCPSVADLALAAAFAGALMWGVKLFNRAGVRRPQPQAHA